MRKIIVLIFCCLALAGVSGCSSSGSAEARKSEMMVDAPAEEVPGWINLFDGISLDGWEKTNFGGQGSVSVSNGTITIQWGEVLTGITYTGDFPVVDYEIHLEAMKLQGNDFFCGLTFPIEDSHATLILGGWGGTVTGITSIMGMDASGNETTTIRKYEPDQWYEVRLRVTEDRLAAWLDGEVIVDMDTEGAEFDTRAEVSLSRPLGIAAYQTSTALRNIRYRTLEESLREGFED